VFHLLRLHTFVLIDFETFTDSGDEDLHLPSLTVSQTFDYALQYREKDPERRKEWLDWLITWLGLTKAKDTVVGDSFLRGVSGGERRRVSVGEQLAANATVNAWDQPTKGLDSTYALVVIKGLRLLNSVLNKTSVIYLNQVSEGIYELFDRVIVLAEGRVIFQGPGELAKDYFVGLGFEPLPRQSVSDFVQQCTERKEQNIRKGFLEEFGRAPPVTAADFEAAWKASPEFARFQVEMAQVKEEAAARNAADEFHEAVIRHREATSSAGTDSIYATTNAQQFATSFRVSTDFESYRPDLADRDHPPTIFFLMGSENTLSWRVKSSWSSPNGFSICRSRSSFHRMRSKSRMTDPGRLPKLLASSFPC